MTGRVHSVESFATLDGTGIRYAVFFSGCNLRCKCCHNADTWDSRGTEYTAEALAKQILRYRTYFKNGGGVTFSGGEPLLQAEFLVELSKILRSEGIHIALDTSGSVQNTSVSELLGLVDLVIADLKCPTEERYRSFAGGSLAGTLSFLREVRKKNVPLWLRTVVIPGINDTEADMEACAALAAEFAPERYELLAFHTMGFSKYEAAGLENPLSDTPALEPDRLAALQSALERELARRAESDRDGGRAGADSK